MIRKIENAVKKYPDRIAYVGRDGSITYKKLWAEVCEKSVLLKKQGSEPVIIYGHKKVDVIISILACLKAGRTYVPVDLHMPVARIKKIIEQTKASLVIKSEPTDIDSIAVCTLEDLHLFSDCEEHVCEDNPVYVIFTSGSTGEAKGVPISQSNLTNFVEWISNLKPLDSFDNVSVLNQASFSFDLSVADLFYAICNGHTLVALDKTAQEDYKEIFDVIKENDVSVCVITPTFMKLCLLNKDFNAKNYPSIKCFYFCGEQLEAKLVKKIFASFPNASVINAYGPTEATSAVSGIEITEEDTEKELLPVGKVGEFATEIFIENDEIVLKGKSVFDGYLGGIKGGFYKDGLVNCYKTGDIGYIENGKLYCKGRLDSQIKFKGYRIELNDIETNLKSVDGVLDAAVIAKYNADKVVKSIKAFVVLNSQQNIENVKSELKKKIPSYMIPNQIKQLDKLPVNDNKKIDRRMLSEL